MGRYMIHIVPIQAQYDQPFMFVIQLCTVAYPNMVIIGIYLGAVILLYYWWTPALCMFECILL